MKKQVTLFLIIPLLFNLLFVGLYFSGIDSLQQLIAPLMIENTHQPSWREFGLVEQLQNIFLLCIVIVFLLATVKREIKLEKFFFASGTIVMLFLFLEEIDYGLHFWHYFTGQSLDIGRLNWHNQQTFSEKENGSYLRRIGDLVEVCWFVLIPLISLRKRIPLVSNIAPSPWLIITLIVGVACSSLAHFLDDSGMGTINGRAGGMSGNISEFRETSSYYLYFLYALQLAKTRPLFNLSIYKE